MHVFITGASGFIGKAVVKDLLTNEHTILALARSDDSATSLAAAGCQIHRGNLNDLESLRTGAAGADGVIHLAFHEGISDFALSNEMDRAAIRTMGEALAGTGKPLVIASGTLGVASPGEIATEDTMPRRDLPISERYEAADTVYKLAREEGIRGIVVRLSPVVHGSGDHGFIPALAGLARKNGRAVYVKDASARWPAVHVKDAAVLFRLALEKGKAGATYNAVAEEGVEVKSIVKVVGRKVGVMVEEVIAQEAGYELGFLALFVGMDGVTSSEKTKRELDWQTNEVEVLKDMEDHYPW